MLISSFHLFFFFTSYCETRDTIVDENRVQEWGGVRGGASAYQLNSLLFLRLTVGGCVCETLL